MADEPAASADNEAQESDRETTGEAEQEALAGHFEPSDFQFAVIVKDDGEGDAGGWQAATHAANFTTRVKGRVIYRWQCRLTVEMPLRSATKGRISAESAALVSATVANAAALPLLSSRNWAGQGAVFCIDLRDRMNAAFKTFPYNGLGAKAKVNT